MARPRDKVSLTTLVTACVWLALTAAGNSEIRSKSTGTVRGSSKGTKKGADPLMDSKSTGDFDRAKDGAGLADDDSPKTRPGSKETVKKKGDRKGTKDPKSSAKRSPAGPSRGSDVTGPQVLVGGDLNLEPET